MDEKFTMYGVLRTYLQLQVTTVQSAVRLREVLRIRDTSKQLEPPGVLRTYVQY